MVRTSRPLIGGETHPEEAISKVEECKKSGDVSDNCKNAKTALYKNQQQDAPVPQIN